MTWRPLLGLCALALACASDTVAPAPDIDCEEGWPISVVEVGCELELEGVGAPSQVRVWRLAIESQTPLRYETVDFALDGSVYVIADGSSEPELVAARLDSSLALEWSLRLVNSEAELGPNERIALGGHWVSEAGLELLSNASGPGTRSGAWWSHVEPDGTCAPSTALRFGSEPESAVWGIVDAENDYILTGGLGYTRSFFIQRRALDGRLLAEVEVASPYGTVLRADPHVLEPGRYIVTYGGTTPYGTQSTYATAETFDSALTSLGTGPSRNLHTDRLGRLYSVARSGTEPVDPADPWGEQTPPTSIQAHRLETSSSPAGDVIELLLPQPTCASPGLTIDDEQRLVISCMLDQEIDTLLGYAGAGQPSWTAQLSCPAEPAFDLGRGRFDAEGRLWLVGSADDGTLFVARVEF